MNLVANYSLIIISIIIGIIAIDSVVLRCID